MINYKQELLISHTELDAYEYRKKLLDDGWRVKSEDTIQTTYIKEIWCTRLANEDPDLNGKYIYMEKRDE